MLWPSRSEYTEAVRDYPHVSLQDLKLKGGKSKRGKDSFLISYAGGFSIVFPIDIASKTFALRCWTQEVGNAELRYERISAYLKQVRLPYFVDFEYVSEGILVNGTKYPITRMEWVEGLSLREFIERNLQNPHIFKVVATEFQKMVAILHQHQISHGDLQDGNILIKQNGANIELKLIDYDSLFVPTLQGQSEQIVGLPEYQHPQRIAGGGKASEKVDHFSELVIYLSFLSLSERRDLWAQFGDKNRVDIGLLFSKKDFENPNQSGIFQALEKLSPDVQQLAATLKDFCAKTSIDQLERLEAILPKPDANTHSDRGEAFLNKGRYNKAIAEFQRAIALDPNYEKAHYGIGLVYLHSKRYTHAIDAFQQAINQNPNYKEAHHGLGRAYLKLGDNSKATASANAALRIDLYYQSARELLDAIKSTTPPPVSPKPKPPPPDPTPKSVIDIWRYITTSLKDNRHFVTIGTLGLALVICFIAFLTQMDAKDKLTSQNDGLKKQLDQTESEIRQKGLEIQSLTFSIQNLKSANQKLNRDNGELRNKLENRGPATNTTSGDVINLRRQLNEQKGENQKLENQLVKKDAEIRQLQNDKAVALSESRKLQSQLVENRQGGTNQSATVRQLQSENLKLQNRNQNLARQNQELQNKNKVLQNQLDSAKQSDSDQVDKSPSRSDDSQQPIVSSQMKDLIAEPPETIQYNNGVITRAGSHNNQGYLDFERNDYDEAVKQFEQAIKADSKFAVAHYNLGCAYLEMKEYSGAVDAFDKTIALDQKFKEAYYNRSLVYFRTSQFQEARQDATKVLDIDPNYQLAKGLLTAIENAQQ